MHEDEKNTSPNNRRRFVNSQKKATITPDPGLLFEKQSTNSGPTIELLTIPEVAELLKISISGVRRLQQGRLIPFIKIGGSVRFTKSDLAVYLKKNRVEPVD
jgi:excisionase family DNA binding protein